MKLIGLTGGIASGKSTVSMLLRALGAAIIDADIIARQVVEPGTPALQEIEQEFGAEYITPQGALDRKKLGALVFSSEAARAKLNEITHPRIAQQMRQQTEEAKEAGKAVAFIEAALLFEAKWDQGLDGVWLVSVPEAVQLARLMGRDGYNEEQARSRIASQMPLSEKQRRATFTIDNAGSKEHTEQQVTAAYQALLTG